MEAIFRNGFPAMIDYSSGATAIAAGEVIVVNGAVRIAHAASVLSADGTNYNQMALAAENGIYDGVKDGTAAVSFSDGDPVFWSAGTNLFTATNTDTFAGYAIADAGATATTVRFIHVMRGTLYSGNMAASGNLAVTGNETVGGTLAVTGATTLSSTVATGALTVTGAASTTTTVTVGTRLLVSASNSAVNAVASTYAALTTNKDIVLIAGITGQTGYGWKLPTGVAGMQITLINTAGFAGVLVPATGGTINGLSANAAVVIAASKTYRCVCTAADTWYVIEAAVATAV